MKTEIWLRAFGYALLLGSLYSGFEILQKSDDKRYTWILYKVEEGEYSLIRDPDTGENTVLKEGTRVQIPPGHYVALSNLRSWLTESLVLGIGGLLALLSSEFFRRRRLLERV